jgi:Bacterial SH3 domain
VTPTATAAPQPTSTPEPAAAASETVWVGNTDGQGVYVRKTPAMADRLRAYPDGTPLTIVGEDVDGDGQHWHHVTTPDGLEGYVPAAYTVDAPP